jgi:hypothetical protein
MPKTRISVCWFPFYQMVIAVDDLHSGKRTAKNLVSDVDSKVKQYEESFNKLKLELQQHAVIYTEITVLRVLTVVGEIGEFSDLGLFPGLIHVTTSRRSST